MELKKSPKADLEKKKGLFLEIGLIFALLFVIGIFSISQAKIVYNDSVADMPVIQEEEIIEITKEPEKVQQQTPKASVQITSDIINIVRDDQKIETEMVFDDFMEDAVISFDANAGGGGGDYTLDDMEVPFAIMENPPTFPNGDFSAWVSRTAKYPDAQRRSGMSGRVVVSFVIERDGTMTDIQVLASPHKAFTDAVLAVLASAPKWTPGRQRGNTVRVRYNVPIDFQLN